MATGTFGIARGWVAAVPIAVGYLPAAAAYGLVARQAGLSVAETVAMSVLIYAGASQFAMAGMIGSGVAAPAIAATAVMMNLRHLLYGAAAAPALSRWSPLRRAAVAFGLTDEVFATTSAVLPGAAQGTLLRFDGLLVLELSAYASWVAGSWLGAVSGRRLLAAVSPAVESALAFALPALFIALLAPQLNRRPALGAAGLGAVAALALEAAGLTGWNVLLAGALGALLGAWLHDRQRGAGGRTRQSRGGALG